MPLLVLRSSDGIGGGKVPLAIAEYALSDVLEEVVFSNRFEDVTCLDLLAVTALSVSLAEFCFSDWFAGGKAGGITCFFLTLSPLLLDGLAFLVRSLDVLDVDSELGVCVAASRREDRLGGRGPSVPFALASSPDCLLRLVSLAIHPSESRRVPYGKSQVSPNSRVGSNACCALSDANCLAAVPPVTVVQPV